MAQKPSFLKKITTASTIAFAAAAIVGTGSTAFGAAVNSVSLNNPSALTVGNDWQQGAAKAVPVAGAGNTIFLGGAHDLSFDAAIGNLGTLNLYGNDGKTVTVTLANQLVNVISTVDAPTIAAVTAANNANANAIAVGAAGVNAKIAFNIDFAGIMEFGNANAGVLTALGNITLSDNAAVMKISANDQHIQQIEGNTVGDGIVQVNATGVVFDQTVGATKAIRQLDILDGKTATLSANAAFDTTGVTIGNASTLTIGNANLTSTNGAKIDGAVLNNGGTLTFAGNSQVGMNVGSVNGLTAINIGAGTVEFKGAGIVKATNIKLTDAISAMKLSTVAQTVTGNIVNTSANNNSGSIIVDGALAHKITGTIGANGKSLAAINFTTAGGQLTLTNPGAPNAAATDLYVKAITTIANAGGNSNGTLVLDGSYNIYSTIGTATNSLNLISITNTTHNAATTTTLKTGNSIDATTINLTAGAVNNILALEADTTVVGNITTGNAGNGTINLTKAGNAFGTVTINGNIGNIANNAISAVNLNGNNLIFGGTQIFANNGNGGLTFAASETLTLNDSVAQANGGAVSAALQIKANIVLAQNGNGIINADALTNAQTLTISGTIGEFNAAAVAPAAIKTASKSLASFDISGGANLDLSAGDSAINALIMGTNSQVKLSHNTYKIVTQNDGNQGKVLINPQNVTANFIGADSYNVTTLAIGTSLGSADTPLQQLQFAAPTVAPNAAVDVALYVAGGTNVYAKTFSAAAANQGTFVFSDAGTSILGVGKANNTTIGTAAAKLNQLVAKNGVTAQVANDAFFNNSTLISSNSTVQIASNYTAKSIVTDTANTAGGILEFVNTGASTVNLIQQAAPIADNEFLTAIKVSGTGNVILIENPAAGGGALVPGSAIATSLIQFSAQSPVELTLPVGVPLDKISIVSAFDNTQNDETPTVITTGVNSTIDVGKAIGTQGNIVELGLASNNTITVNAGDTFFAGIAGIGDRQGTVNLSAANNGQVFGLINLNTVNVTTNYTNTGDLDANNTNVSDGMTITTGGQGYGIGGAITLGSATGVNSKLVIKNETTFVDNFTVNGKVANQGILTFQGEAYINGIGKILL